LSDWNHGNAHFLRGVVRELLARGHAVDVYEPALGWSLSHLLDEHGAAPVRRFRRQFPELHTHFYLAELLDLGRVLEGADAVIVHEWSDPVLIERLGAYRRRGGSFRLLLHDTHHRAVTAPEGFAALDWSGWDGVL